MVNPSPGVAKIQQCTLYDVWCICVFRLKFVIFALIPVLAKPLMCGMWFGFFIECLISMVGQQKFLLCTFP